MQGNGHSVLVIWLRNSGR